MIEEMVKVTWVICPWCHSNNCYVGKGYPYMDDDERYCADCQRKWADPGGCD